MQNKVHGLFFLLRAEQEGVIKTSNKDVLPAQRFKYHKLESYVCSCKSVNFFHETRNVKFYYPSTVKGQIYFP